MSLTRSICALLMVVALPFAARSQQAKDPEVEMASAIAYRYMALAGTRENAVALAYSLRNGERVILVRDAGGVRLPTMAVFELPTRRMQWDDVGCLALVEGPLPEACTNPRPINSRARYCVCCRCSATASSGKRIPEFRSEERAAE
jgi:hypothetical protein